VSPFTTPRSNSFRSLSDRPQLLSRRSSPAPAAVATTADDVGGSSSSRTADLGAQVSGLTASVATVPVTTPLSGIDDKGKIY